MDPRHASDEETGVRGGTPIESVKGLRSRLVRAAREELVENGHAGVSLRAVARRAGVSHAAPAYHFGDRRGLLTAVVVEGFRELAAALDAPAPRAGTGSDMPRLELLGRRYLDFASDERALYELMFRPAELDPDDPDLVAARRASLAALVGATSPGSAPNALTLVSWALAHGLATLQAQGALGVVGGGTDTGGSPPGSSDDTAGALLGAYVSWVSRP